jgi:hypothetical protein
MAGVCGKEVEKKCPNADNWYDLPPLIFCNKSDCIKALTQAIATCNGITGLNERTACLRAAVDLEKACNKILPGGGGKFDGSSQPYSNDVQ